MCPPLNKNIHELGKTCPIIRLALAFLSFSLFYPGIFLEPAALQEDELQLLVMGQWGIPLSCAFGCHQAGFPGLVLASILSPILSFPIGPLDQGIWGN